MTKNQTPSQPTRKSRRKAGEDPEFEPEGSEVKETPSTIAARKEESADHPEEERDQQNEAESSKAKKKKSTPQFDEDLEDI